MNKYAFSTFSIILFFPSLACAQSVYMHEAQDDAANSEPISALGIIAFAILVGVLYLIYKIIGEASSKYEKKKFEAKLEESKRQQTTINEGGFICPNCGKHVLDSNYETMWRKLEGKGYTIKFCKNCGDYYRWYEMDYENYQRRNKDELPYWFIILLYVIMIALGLAILIMSCITGDVLFGIIYMFLAPLFIAAILVWTYKLFIKLFWGPKPREPFKIPSLEHIKKCNAIEE